MTPRPVTRFFDRVSLSFYVTDDWKASIGYRYFDGKHSLSFGTEYAIPNVVELRVCRRFDRRRQRAAAGNRSGRLAARLIGGDDRAVVAELDAGDAVQRPASEIGLAFRPDMAVMHAAVLIPMRVVAVESDKSLLRTMSFRVALLSSTLPMIAFAGDDPPSTRAVDGVNGKIEGFGGGYATKGLYGTIGSLSLPLGVVQFDGAAGSFASPFIGMGTAKALLDGRARGLARDLADADRQAEVWSSNSRGRLRASMASAPG